MMDRLAGDEEGTIERGAAPVTPPAQNPLVYSCAICIHLACSPILTATTMVNGTAVCTKHCVEVPRTALPIGS